MLRIASRLKKKLKAWENLQLSLWGRIATIKMNVLPKILFLYQNLPILTSVKLINDLDKAIRKFIWYNKKARIKSKYLQDKKESGSYVVLNFTLYYQASSIVCLKNWCVFFFFEGLNHIA